MILEKIKKDQIDIHKSLHWRIFRRLAEEIQELFVSRV